MSINEVLKSAYHLMCIRRGKWKTQYVVVRKDLGGGRWHTLDFGDSAVESWGNKRWTPTLEDLQATDWERIT
jgi:hypothetical protein